MHNRLSSYVHRKHPKTVLLPMSRRIVTIVAALCCTPLLASEVDDNAKFNATSTPQADIPWISGGIGDDARVEMRKSVTAYNLQIVFSDRQGSYLASVPFVVMGYNGREVLAGVSEGPLLYIKLPPATYQVSAKIDGVWQNKQIQAGTIDRPVRMTFVGQGE